MNNNLVRQLNAIYEKKREQHKFEHDERKKQVYKRIPNVKMIDQEMVNMANRIVSLVMQKPDQTTSAVEEMRKISLQLSKEKKNALKQAGLAEDYLEPIYDCMHCKDRGYLEDGTRCSCFQEELLKLVYQDSALKNRLLKDNFDTFNFSIFSDTVDEGEKISQRDNIKTIVQRIRLFIDEFDKQNSDNLLFYGNTGLGKTFLCTAIAKKMIDLNRRVVYQTAKELFDVINKERFKYEQSKESIENNKLKFDMIYNCELLIIDDLGTEYPSSFVPSDFFDIVNYRLLNEKKTIISTNFSMNNISDEYGERIASRLMGAYVKLKFIGKDLRY